MPILTVKHPKGVRRIPCRSGRIVRDVLDETDLRVRAGCNGRGACGLCRISVSSGDAGSPTDNEQAVLGVALLSQGVRLACQVEADHDLVVELLNVAPPSVWRSLGEEVGSATLPVTTTLAASKDTGNALGAAVDVGTTHLSIAVRDLVTGRRLAGRRGLNPQADSGADVVTRLLSAASSGQALHLSRQVVQAIGDGLHDIGTREGIDLRSIKLVVLAGNTAMLSLLSGKNHHLLLQPRYWTEPIECLPEETAPWAAAWGIGPEAVVEVVPPLAGFVGSDLLAGVVATGLMERGPGAFLIDFGTNTEMALWDGKTLRVTSAAGGPAFEGSGISCGMPAEPAAIYRVVRTSSMQGGLQFDVISGAEPRGLCGSGLVDLLACLVGNGTLNSKGQFAASVPGHGFPLVSGSPGITLTRKDVDMFQRAKAAVGTGVSVLLSEAGMGYHDLQRICIGGIFGQYLDVKNAQAIGLLPPISLQEFEIAGNTALAGCEALLFASDRQARIKELRRKVVIINLSACADFETIFLDQLYLRQSGVETPLTK